MADRRLLGMDWNRFWDSTFWGRVKKVSARASIIAALVAIAWFSYTIWRDRSVVQSQPTPSQLGSSIVNLWTPTYVIGGCLILAAVVHLLAAFMSRRGLKKQLADVSETNETLTGDLNAAHVALGMDGKEEREGM